VEKVVIFQKIPPRAVFCGIWCFWHKIHPHGAQNCREKAFTMLTRLINVEEKALTMVTEWSESTYHAKYTN
jgi:hypothetical protein